MNQTEGVSGDLLQIIESQSDLRDRLIEHSEDLKVIKEKQETHSELLSQLIGIGEEHTKSFTEIKATMATKDDISNLKDDISNLEMRIKSDVQAMESRLLEAMKAMLKG